MKHDHSGFQSVLAGSIERFLAHKRALGRRFDVEEKTLRLLDRYLKKRHIRFVRAITPQFIDDFLASRGFRRSRSYNHLLCTIRRLFDWLVDQGSLPCSPVQARPRRQTDQRIPFIFDIEAARKLLEVARSFRNNSRAPMRAKTYYTIFAILYGLGLRVGEVCRLTIQDVDLERRLLVIRETKFYKSRLVPFGPRMESLLRDYIDAKMRIVGPFNESSPVFSFTQRGEVNPGTVSQTFHKMIIQIGYRVSPGHAQPRLHDLRHSFAVGTLLRWYRQGIDPGSGLLKLATFLGHVDATSTAVYLRITPDLLREANRRFESFSSDVVTGRSLP
jgi:site-specific recombinase XerD